MLTTEQHELFAGLRELAESAFPKQCRNCGREYATAQEFITATQPLSADRSGLKSSLDDDGEVILELFRNCVCGSTMMDNFNDRRDTSETGARKRQRFSELHTHLVNQGVEPTLATLELRKVARGQPSELLAKIATPPNTNNT